ncbi:MAG: nucleotidyltransferase domain-containing protein [Verrucomicrobia bacterium]|nr:nucleotidyltransferase domain-containing protein [Verrucomicrobiota bacterium]
MTLLQRMEVARQAANERLRGETRKQLEAALAELLPGATVYLFGSLLKPCQFSDVSDVDLALVEEPAHLSVYQLTSLLAERLGRPVDVLVLAECRFRDRIVQEGERWTTPG